MPGSLPQVCQRLLKAAAAHASQLPNGGLQAAVGVGLRACASRGVHHAAGSHAAAQPAFKVDHHEDLDDINADRRASHAEASTSSRAFAQDGYGDYMHALRDRPSSSTQQLPHEPSASSSLPPSAAATAMAQTSTETSVSVSADEHVTIGLQDNERQLAYPTDVDASFKAYAESLRTLQHPGVGENIPWAQLQLLYER